jgi:hypothetical protein
MGHLIPALRAFLETTAGLKATCLPKLCIALYCYLRAFLNVYNLLLLPTLSDDMQEAWMQVQ